MFASPTSWIESDAVAQCHQVAALDGMIHVAGMPDLHPGKGAPIGAAMASTVLYPFLVGSDIGCGIAVFPIKLKRAVPEKLAARFPDLDRALDPERDADDPAWAVVDGDIPAGHVEGLGTVGRGNHFVELARIETVFEPGHASRLGLAAGDLVLIVHSGSRGLGERILRAHTEVHGAGPAADPAAYLAMHDDAVRWGSLNRRLMAARVAHALGAEPTEPIVDQCHNLVEVRDGVYLHRKGAAPGDGRDVLIAGTRGTRSYLVAAPRRAGGQPFRGARRGPQDVARRRPAPRPGQAHGRGAAPHAGGVAGGVRRPAAALRGGADGVQADRAGDRRPRRPRPGHAGGHHGPAGHLQDARPRVHAPAGPPGPPPQARPAVNRPVGGTRCLGA